MCIPPPWWGGTPKKFPPQGVRAMGGDKNSPPTVFKSWGGRKLSPPMKKLSPPIDCPKSVQNLSKLCPKSKICQNSVQNQSNIYKNIKLVKHLSKIYTKSIKKPVLGAPWGSIGGPLGDSLLELNAYVGLQTGFKKR